MGQRALCRALEPCMCRREEEAVWIPGASMED
jgi:hypothetical protein